MDGYTPDVVPRTRACGKCRKSKRRCIHDEDGNIDPEKEGAAPVRPVGYFSQIRRKAGELGSAGQQKSSLAWSGGDENPELSEASSESHQTFDTGDTADSPEPDSSLASSEEVDASSNSGDEAAWESDPVGVDPAQVQARSSMMSGEDSDQPIDLNSGPLAASADQSQQQDAHVYLTMAYPQPSRPWLLPPLIMNPNTQGASLNANAHASYQYITPAPTPATTPAAGTYPPLDFAHAARIPVLSISKEQLKRERREEIEAKTRGESPPPLSLPGTKIKLGVGSARKVGGAQKKKNAATTSIKQAQPGSLSKPQKQSRKKALQKQPHRIPKPPSKPLSIFINEPEVKQLAPPDVCTVHGRGCHLSSRLCQVHQFTWVNPLTGEHEVRLSSNVPMREGRLGNSRPDFESIGIDTRLETNGETGLQEEVISLRTGKPADTSEFWWDLWIGNIAFQSENVLVKQLCLAMQNKRAENEVPRVVTPARLLGDEDAPRNSHKWLRYRDGRGLARLSQMDHWEYLCEEAKRKWEEMAKGKLGNRHRRLLAERTARACVQEVRRRRNSRTEMVVDENNGFVAEMRSTQQVKEVSEGGGQQTSWKPIIKKVQLGYRRKVDSEEGDHWVSAEEWRELARKDGFNYRETQAPLPTDVPADEKPVESLGQARDGQ